MKAADIISAFTLPKECRVDRRVSKKLLVQNGAPTAADKRHINEGIAELVWVAALKPTTIGVPEYRDPTREYLEIAVLTVMLRASSKANRIIELIHRAIPYPLALVTSLADTVSLSLAHKRWSEGEIGKVVIEQIRQTHQIRQDTCTSEDASFLNSLALARLPRQNIFALYQGWLNRIAALEAALITGIFKTPDSFDLGIELQEAVDKYSQLGREITTLRVKATKEKQINRRAELNLEIKQLEAELAKVKILLMGKDIL